MIKKFFNRLSVLVSLTFFTGIGSIVSGVAFYWFSVLVPSIRLSELTKAELLVTYMTDHLEIAVESGDRSIIEIEMQRLQLLKDPETQENFILSIQVRRLTEERNIVIPSDRKIALRLFTVSSPLFSNTTNSLLGEVIIEYNHLFYENLLDDAREKMFWFLGLVILVWMHMQIVVIWLLKPFSSLNSALDNIDFSKSAILQPVKGFMTKEINEVVNSIRNLLGRLETTRIAEQESEKKYRSLFYSMVAASAYCRIIVNEKEEPVDWVYLDLNKSFEKMIDKSRDEIIDKKFSEVMPGLKKSDPDLISIYGEVARTGKETNFERYLEPFKKWVSISVYSPAIDYFVVLIDDIAEKKKAEEILKTAQAELEKQVDRRTADLRAANEEIKRFAYVVSHDMKSPLINIKGFAGELRISMVTCKDIFRELKPLLKEEQVEKITQSMFIDIPEALTFIETSVTRMDNLINAIMKLSRIGKRELVIEKIKTDSLINVIINSMLHQIEKKGAKVKVLRLPDIKADRVALEQIFSNLLDNAVKYLDPSRPGEIEISGESSGSFTVFKIIDNGRGIAPNDILNIFNPFVRAGERTSDGEGMGLAFVNTLVRNHGGAISCESEIRKGTSFSFTISNNLINRDLEHE